MLSERTYALRAQCDAIGKTLIVNSPADEFAADCSVRCPQRIGSLHEELRWRQRTLQQLCPIDPNASYGCR